MGTQSQLLSNLGNILCYKAPLSFCKKRLINFPNMTIMMTNDDHYDVDDDTKGTVTREAKSGDSLR